MPRTTEYRTSYGDRWEEDEEPAAEYRTPELHLTDKLMVTDWKAVDLGNSNMNEIREEAKLMRDNPGWNSAEPEHTETEAERFIRKTLDAIEFSAKSFMDQSFELASEQARRRLLYNLEQEGRSKTDWKERGAGLLAYRMSTDDTRMEYADQNPRTGEYK